MAISSIFSFLVHPGKGNVDATPVSGTSIPLSKETKLLKMLREVYERSPVECDIDIAFNHAASGAQQNDCRDLLLKHLAKPSLSTSQALASRLQEQTTHRSKLGLFFAILGKEDGQQRILLSRFPADSGILAEQTDGKLVVEFIERVFMKNATSYKSAVYQDSSAAGFWTGRAVDKQINDDARGTSDYWIKDFLLSDLRTTAEQGTRRFAVALRNAVNAAEDPLVRQELVSVASLASGLARTRISISEIAKRFSLSAPSIKALQDQIKSQTVFGERFQFSREEFTKHAAYRATKLDTGAVLLAPATTFEELFQDEPVAGSKDKRRFSTIGAVIGQRIRKTDA